MRIENAYDCMFFAPARAILLIGYHDCHGFYPPFLFDKGQLVNIEGKTRTDYGKSIENETREAFIERWNMEAKADKLKKIIIRECNGDLNNGWFRNNISLLPVINK